MASKYKIVLSSSARCELDEIREYIAGESGSTESASKQVERILKAMRAIEVFPKMYRVRRKDTGMRICPVDNYLIMYFVDDESHIVRVSHIIHGRRDINAII